MVVSFKGVSWFVYALCGECFVKQFHIETNELDNYLGSRMYNFMQIVSQFACRKWSTPPFLIYRVINLYSSVIRDTKETFR